MLLKCDLRLELLANSYSYIGMWYKRSEAQKRYSLFFSSTSLAGAFGGLLASAIGKCMSSNSYRQQTCRAAADTVTSGWGTGPFRVEVDFHP
jgi:MFS family permease